MIAELKTWQTVTLGEVCQIQRGGSPRPISSFITNAEDGLNWIKIGDVAEGAKYICSTAEKIKPEGAKSSRQVEYGDFLLSNSMSFGRPYILRTSGCIHDGWLLLRYDKSLLNEDYLYFVLGSSLVYNQFKRLAAGAVVKNLNSEVVKQVTIPLPPLTEQRRIAAILDKADGLRTQHTKAFAQLDVLVGSIFTEVFGDPKLNPKNWHWKPLGWIASRFSDGPFGSNLKSEHYEESGVRVVRLRNIGVGEFLDDDKAYISDDHFQSIKKHECQPGDVIVGTMGEPNLRACILPQSIPIAINKADCVQVRVNPTRANSQFVCALLNHPSTEALARELMHGQTRVRISMGSLRALEVPIPPLSLQCSFAEKIDKVNELKLAHARAGKTFDALFASLQHRAFRGAL